MRIAAEPTSLGYVIEFVLLKLDSASPALVAAEFGSPPRTTCNHGQPHDFIEITFDELSEIGPRLKPLYDKGHSLKELSAMTGIPYSTIRSHLVAVGVTLRTNRSVSSNKILRQGFKNSAPPPFGYCYLDGRLEKDPREYPTFQIIREQWRRGQNPTSIARYLNDRKIKTRTGKAWQQPTVFYIIQRLKSEIATPSNKEQKV